MVIFVEPSCSEQDIVATKSVWYTRVRACVRPSVRICPNTVEKRENVGN